MVVVDRPAPPRPVRAGGHDVALMDEQEPNDDLEHAQPLQLPKGIKGTIAPAPAARRTVGRTKGRMEGRMGGPAAPRGDVDYYRWTVGGVGKQTARVELEGAPGFTPALDALDENGEKIVAAAPASDGASGEPLVIPNLAVEGGRTLYFRVSAQSSGDRVDKANSPQVGLPEQPHAYSLTVLPSPWLAGEEEEPNDAPDRANAMAGPEASGFFGRRHDEDWLRLQGGNRPAGATVRLELSAIEGVTPSLRVTDAAGKVAVQAHGARGDELRLRNAPLIAAADAAGVTLVGLRAEGGWSGDTRWTLRTLVESPLDGAEVEPNDTLPTATLVDAARGVSGFLWPGDIDLFKVHLAGPSIARVELEVPEGVDAKLEWLDEGSHVRMRSDEGGPGKSETLPALFQAGGDLYVRVSARPHDTAFDSPYKLTFLVTPDDGETEHEPNANAAEATPISAGRAMRGFLFPRRDEDWYRVIAPDGVTAITAEAQGGPSGLEVKITDEKGMSIGKGKGGSGPGMVASAAAQAGASLFVVVRDASAKQASSSDPYRLTVAFE